MPLTVYVCVSVVAYKFICPFLLSHRSRAHFSTFFFWLPATSIAFPPHFCCLALTGGHQMHSARPATPPPAARPQGGLIAGVGTKEKGQSHGEHSKMHCIYQFVRARANHEKCSGRIYVINKNGVKYFLPVDWAVNSFSMDQHLTQFKKVHISIYSTQRQVLYLYLPIYSFDWSWA